MIGTWGLAGLFHTILPYVDDPSQVDQLPLQQQQALLNFLRDALAAYQWLHIRSGHEVVISKRKDPYQDKLSALKDHLELTVSASLPSKGGRLQSAAKTEASDDIVSKKISWESQGNLTDIARLLLIL
jgi:hypothetical protein